MCVCVFQVPLMNGQVRAPMSASQAPMSASQAPMSASQAPMARHPSREQLIDYLMLKVSQQPGGPPRLPHDILQQEVRTPVTSRPPAL